MYVALWLLILAAGLLLLFLPRRLAPKSPGGRGLFIALRLLGLLLATVAAFFLRGTAGGGPPVW